MTKKVNLAVALKDLNGEAITDAKGEKVIIGRFVANALVGKEAKGDNVLQRFELAMKLNAAKGEVEVTDSEQSLIKDAVIGSGATVLLAAQVFQILA